MTSHWVLLGNALTYEIKGAATLAEALERDLKIQFGDNIKIEYWHDLYPNDPKLLNKKPEPPSLRVRVTQLPDTEAPVTIRL